MTRAGACDDISPWPANESLTTLCTLPHCHSIACMHMQVQFRLSVQHEPVFNPVEPDATSIVCHRPDTLLAHTCGQNRSACEQFVQHKRAPRPLLSFLTRDGVMNVRMLTATLLPPTVQVHFVSKHGTLKQKIPMDDDGVADCTPCCCCLCVLLCPAAVGMKRDPPVVLRGVLVGSQLMPKEQSDPLLASLQGDWYVYQPSPVAAAVILQRRISRTKSHTSI
jgi:hypothetical protein